MKVYAKTLTLLGLISMNFYGMNDAFEALEKGKSCLNNHYDYENAIKFFSIADEFYQEHSGEINEFKAQAWLGLAMSYHNIGNIAQRDQYMGKLKKILGIPDNMSEFNDKSKFSENSVGFFVINGYRFYIYFEQFKKYSSALDLQETALLSAKESFLKAIEIADALNLTTELATHAHQGLGTVFEFLSACQIERNDIITAEKYILQSMFEFEESLNTRKKLLGENHIHVARSCHKLARSYINYYKTICGKNTSNSYYVKQAKNCYETALAIYEKNKIECFHPKYKELIEEYNEFKKSLLILQEA